MKNAPPRPPISFFLFCQGRKLRTGLSTGDLLLDNQCFFRGGKQANFAGAPGARSASLHRWRRFNRRERRASPRRLPSAHSHTSASIPAHRPAKENVPQQSKWDLGNFFRPALEKKVPPHSYFEGKKTQTYVCSATRDKGRSIHSELTTHLKKKKGETLDASFKGRTKKKKDIYCSQVLERLRPV